MLAEHLRQMRFLAPLGRVTPFSRLPAHHASSDIRSSWVYWHFRAIAREGGLVSVKFDSSYLEAYRILLRDALLIGNEASEKDAAKRVTGQLNYHRSNANRFKKLDHRLHILGIILFSATIFACAVHLLMPVHFLVEWLTLVAAVFPAFGAAFIAIRNHGEFSRIVRRSLAMCYKLEHLAIQLNEAGRILSANELGRIAENAADCMIAEVLDWRILFQERPLILPA